MRRALFLILLGTSVAAAQPKKAPAKAAPAKKSVPPPRDNYYAPQPANDAVPHREGEYTGVSPHGTSPKDKPKTKIRPAKGTLSWIGFEAKDGGAQLFFQSVAAFNVTQKIEKDTLVVHLSLPRLGQNTWRQIDTRYFDNPLSFVIARASRGGIDIRITFKNPKDAKEGTLKAASADADGMFYAYLTFPEGSGDKGTTVKEPEK